jgi:hypothetical protein
MLFVKLLQNIILHFYENKQKKAGYKNIGIKNAILLTQDHFFPSTGIGCFDIFHFTRQIRCYKHILK